MKGKDEVRREFRGNKGVTELGMGIVEGRTFI